MPIKLLMAVSLEKKIEGRVGWSVVKVGDVPAYTHRIKV